MADADNHRRVWAAALGGLHTLSAAAALVGADADSVQSATEAGRVIVLQDSKGRDLYPGFQFQHGWPPPTLLTAWRTVAATSDPWTAASWAATPDPRLGDMAPADYAVVAGAEQRLLELAEHDAAHLVL